MTAVLDFVEDPVTRYNRISVYKNWLQVVSMEKRKTIFNIEILVILDQGQRITLTFDIHVGEFIYSFSGLRLPTLIPQSAIVSEKSIVFTFSYIFSYMKE